MAEPGVPAPAASVKVPVNTARRLAALGAAVPEILLPKQGIDLEKWAVIACDQFTQDRAYWEKTAAAAGGSPSAFHCIIPEAFLDDPGRKERIGRIHAAMAGYLEGGLFDSRMGCVYVERDTPFRSKRRGLLVCLDLECYDWTPGSESLVRPTEGTVPERLPPRMEIRGGAALDLPHILVLVDDEEDFLMTALEQYAGSALYDTRLMSGAGRVRGRLLDTEEGFECLAGGLERLAAASCFRYGTGKPFLYAVGDGNHSLAAAKAVWEAYRNARKDEPGILSHPSRWALVELENLYDPALVFEPIHRFMFGTGLETLKRLLEALPGFSCAETGRGPGAGAKLRSLTAESADKTRFGLVEGDRYFLAETDSLPLAVERIQPLIEGLPADYIHGGEELFRLAAASKGSGILLPPFDKHSLFRTVAEKGMLPRKSFSMGEATEKRFYLECRRLFA